MDPLPLFFHHRPRRGVSELYASVLMVGVTISLGGVLVAAAMGSIGQAQSASALGASLLQSASGKELGIIYAAVASSGSCPTYRGVNEGTVMTVALFDYGSDGFTPAEFVVNSTMYAGSYHSLAPGAMGQFVLTLGSCAHSSGQTITAVDAQGDEAQFES